MTEPIVSQQSPAGNVGGVQNQNPNEPVVDIGGVKVSQNALDDLLKDRLAKAKDGVRGEYREKYKDYDALKAEAEEGRKLKAAQMSESEKMQARLKELETDNLNKAEQLAILTFESDVRSDIEKLISEGKISLPKGSSVSDVIALVDVNTSTGEKDYTRLLKVCPVNRSLGGSSQGGHSPGANPEQTFQEQYNKLMKEGRMVEAIALKNAHLKGLHPDVWAGK
jgi:hypothetical protein